MRPRANTELKTCGRGWESISGVVEVLPGVRWVVEHYQAGLERNRFPCAVRSFSVCAKCPTSLDLPRNPDKAAVRQSTRHLESEPKPRRTAAVRKDCCLPGIP